MMKNKLPLERDPRVPLVVIVDSHYTWIVNHQKKSRLHDKLFIAVSLVALLSLLLHFVK